MGMISVVNAINNKAFFQDVPNKFTHYYSTVIISSCQKSFKILFKISPYIILTLEQWDILWKQININVLFDNIVDYSVALCVSRRFLLWQPAKGRITHPEIIWCIKCPRLQSLFYPWYGLPIDLTLELSRCSWWEQFSFSLV